ncbi:MAG: helix-turn-helix transcriptional regulator [Chitinispirillaceae bacterium]|nr:helix-turn-helix transcriptional regulator [Chitinispirillaceae bacterium]
MLHDRHELLSRFTDPVFIPHPSYQEAIRTFSCMTGWSEFPVVEIPKLRIEIRGVDYLEYSLTRGEHQPIPLRFHQDSYTLWYQVDGYGILQNTTRNVFGTARPGLLGIMERGQRYSYLHQKGVFESFLLRFSLLPAAGAKCYWNSVVEGKTILEGNDRTVVDNLIFDLFLVRSRNGIDRELATASRFLELLAVLFAKGLVHIRESQFPKNKQKSLVAKAQAFMECNYSRVCRQGDLERECGVDINYLNILFKKETGVTLYDYLVTVRLERAKHLLETTGSPVADIAAQTGYPNANSFSRAFKHRENRSPTDYRRLSRAAPAHPPRKEPS